MSGLGEGCKKPYSEQVGCIIKLALKGSLDEDIKVFTVLCSRFI